MFEIIKIFASGIVTFFAVWIGARLSQNTQMKHLRTQNLNYNHDKWKEHFVENISTIISTLKTVYSKLIFDVEFGKKPDPNDYYNKEVAPKLNSSVAKIKLSLDLENGLSYTLINKIASIINSTLSAIDKDNNVNYEITIFNDDLNEVVHICHKIIKEKEQEVSEQIQKL